MGCQKREENRRVKRRYHNKIERSSTMTIGYIADNDNLASHAPNLSLACNGQHIAAGTELTNAQASITIWCLDHEILRQSTESLIV